MSLARKHRERTLASLTAAVLLGEDGGPALPAAIGPAATAAAQMAMRLTHDRRRLKEIQSLERKIEAKREMLPEYQAWVEGILAADAPESMGAADAIVPTIMVWKIDTGDYAGALSIADFVLRHNIPLPDHYQRQAATLIAEEIAEAALRTLAADQAFPLDILEEVDLLTEDADMHDEVRAKLFKAIGLERARAAETAEPLVAQDLQAALAALRRAQQLNDRIGVKDRIKRLERMIAKLADAPQGDGADPATTSSDNAGAAG